MNAAAIAASFRDACLDELAAPKPGNVHRYGHGHHMTVADFERSADVAAPLLCAAGLPLGRRIRDAVVATRHAVGQNTNLGVLLLCGPVAMAAERSSPALQPAVARVLAGSDVADARDIFAAIRLASPGGLGSAARHDVHAPAHVTALQAMAEAAHRDSIARQWTNGLGDIFGDGIDVYRAAAARWRAPTWATLAVYLHFLATFRDTHVVRKHGDAVAESVRRQAMACGAALHRASDPLSLMPALLDWDETLKHASINPGTSADLTVATCFVHRLQSILPKAIDDG